MTYKEGMGMYNTEVKELYLKTSSNLMITKSYLNKLEPFEIKLDKDFGEFTDTEVKESVLDIVKNLKAGNTISVVLANIKKYLLWYCEYYNKETYNISEVFNEIRKEKNVNVRYYKSFSDFFEDLYTNMYDDVLKQNFSQTLIREKRQLIFDRYNVGLCSALLAWCGLSSDEICNLKVTDVDFNNATIRLSDREVSFSNTIQEVLERTIYANNYIDKNGEYGRYESSCYVLRRQQVGQSYYNEIDSNKIESENGNNTPVLKYYMQRQVSHILPGLAISSIRENGSFVRMYEKMKEENVFRNGKLPKRIDNSVYYEDWILKLPCGLKQDTILRFRLFVRDMNK